MERFIGIEIGGTKLQLLLGDQDCRICERRRLAVEPGRGGAGIREQIRAALPEFLVGPSANKVAAIGVGFGGPVDCRTGKICRSHQIEGWSEFDLKGWLEELSRIPVHVDNDANLATLGEARQGAGAGFNPVFYVTLGSGVGGGLVVDGEVYHGAIPGEAEIGHVRLDRAGTIVEERCSGWAVDRRVRALKKKEPTSVLARLAAGADQGEAKYLPEALRQNDPSAKRILAETAEDLAFGLSHVVHLFHPQIIIIGGGLSGVGEPLRSAVESALARFVMDAFAPGPKIVLAKLAEDAVPTGALELARQRTIGKRTAF